MNECLSKRYIYFEPVVGAWSPIMSILVDSVHTLSVDSSKNLWVQRECLWWVVDPLYLSLQGGFPRANRACHPKLVSDLQARRTRPSHDL